VQYKERRYYELMGEDHGAAFEARTGQKLSDAAYLEEYMAAPRVTSGNREGMDNGEGGLRVLGCL
jgi:hypothetical protein